MVSTIISICWCTVSSGGVGGYEHLPLQIKSQCAIHCRVSSPHDIVYTLSSRQGRETTLCRVVLPSFLPTGYPHLPVSVQSALQWGSHNNRCDEVHFRATIDDNNNTKTQEVFIHTCRQKRRNDMA